MLSPITSQANTAVENHEIYPHHALPPARNGTLYTCGLTHLKVGFERRDCSFNRQYGLDYQNWLYLCNQSNG